MGEWAREAREGRGDIFRAYHREKLKKVKKFFDFQSIFYNMLPF